MNVIFLSLKPMQFDFKKKHETESPGIDAIKRSLMSRPITFGLPCMRKGCIFKCVQNVVGRMYKCVGRKAPRHSSEEETPVVTEQWPVVLPTFMSTRLGL